MVHNTIDQYATNRKVEYDRYLQDTIISYQLYFGPPRKIDDPIISVLPIDPKRLVISHPG